MRKAAITTGLFLVLTGAVWGQVIPSFERPWLDETGNLRLVLRGGAGVSYTIEGSTNLVDWVALYTGSADDGRLELMSSDALDGQGFFRARALIDLSVNPTNPPSLSGMVLIPAGSFQMGNSMDRSEGWWWSEVPEHTVEVSAFRMDKILVTKALWDQVHAWAKSHGYAFEHPDSGQGKAANHPVHSVTWYDTVKWCNARSEREGRVPAYYLDAEQTAVYRGGKVDVENGWVKWNAGYRLPTEAEWEKAARGGAKGQRFPWSNVDTITHAQANYQSSTNLSGNPVSSYDVGPTRGYHPAFNDGTLLYTSPVGYFAPNGYGLYDMAGNVRVWCWDHFDSN